MKLDSYLTILKKKLAQNGSKTSMSELKLCRLNLHDLEFGSDFLDLMLKTQVTKKEIGKLELIKFKNLFFQRPYREVNKFKLEKIIHISCFLVSTIYKELLQLHSEKTI